MSGVDDPLSPERWAKYDAAMAAYDFPEGETGEERLHRQRAAVLDRKCLPPMPRKFTSAIVGVTFVPEYPHNLQALQEMAWKRLWREGAMEPIPAVLIRRPDNDVDPNAIEVHVTCLGDNGRIGHIPRAVAARLAPHLDADEPWQAAVVGVRQIDWKPEQPGIDVEVSYVQA